MKRIRIIGLALVAVFAISAIASATASAAKPEFVFAGIKKGLKAKSGSATLETASKEKVTCTSSSNGGEIEGGNGSKKVTGIIVKFKGCKSSGFACSTSGAASEEIITNSLSGELGYIKAAEKTVGLDLLPTGGGEFVEFNCAGGIVKVKVKGSVIGQITPVNKKVTTAEHFTLTFTQSGGKQGIEKFETGVKDTLETSKNGGAFEGSAEAATAEVTGEETVEISA